MTATDLGLVTVTHKAQGKRRFRRLAIEDARHAVEHAYRIFVGSVGAASIEVFVTAESDVVEIEERVGYRASARRFESIDGWMVERFGSSTYLEDCHATGPA